jgi:glycosyltransferase involved in cell wall biosynthesis
MRIAHIAPLWLTVPPKDYGGLESILSYLVEEQVRQGHEVTLFACGGSQTKGNLVEVIEKPMYELLGKFDWSAVHPYEFITFYELLKRIDDFDVVHNHMGFHPLSLTPRIPIPVVTTNHSSVAPDFPYLAELFKNENFVSISEAQRANAPYLNYIDNVYNALDPALFDPNFEATDDYFFFIGTLSKNKGVDIAVKAAKQSGHKLILAGEIRPEDQEWLDKEVMPLVDGEQIKFIGRANFEQKVELFRKAKALLFPSQWNEAFGMVAIEALACGTPVIGWKSGAIPEIIEHGRTGFVADNMESFIDAMNNIGTIDRKVCREELEKRFSVKAMAEHYVQIYQKLIDSKK